MAKESYAIGYAAFESGKGKRMRIEFPEVMEFDACMNVGVALMPFMDKGFYFFEENRMSVPLSEEGFNKVELEFVKYLYKIRKANSENKKLEYNWFKSPSKLSIKQRIFIGGTIFPVLSLSYKDKDIDCSTSKIKRGTVNVRELILLFGEMFGEYKEFSWEYINIDNNTLRIYVPKHTRMNIDYTGVLIDFLTNGEKTKIATTHGEFPDIETYKLATNKIELTEGCWLTKHRKNKEKKWEDACMYIVKNKLQGVLAPFGQIADFYTLLDDKITNETQHKTRWLKGAKKLVQSLRVMDRGFTAIANDIEIILNELNIGICNYAITQFYELFYGEYKNCPLDDPQKAYEWDLAFVKHEQGVVAVPIYEKTKRNTIGKYQDMADKDSKGFHGFGSWFMDAVGLNIIPEFDDPWEGKVTDAQFRIDLPMLMLWLDRHKPTGKNFEDKIDENGYLMKEYKKIIEPYEVE